MHILFLSDNFPPEVNAPASRTFEHCREWVKKGHRVTVVTCAPNFPAGKVFDGYRNRLFQRERIDGIEVVRVWTYITANEGFVGRTLDYVSFMIAAVLAAPFLKRPDLVIGTSPQFFTVCAAYVVSRLKRVPFVFELRDLWPESIKAVGAMRQGRVIAMLEAVEMFLYRKAALVVANSPAFKADLVERGIAAGKMEIVINGADLTRFKPMPKDEALMERLGLGGKFVGGYVGTHGMAHALETLLEAARQLRQLPDGDAYHILLLGDGANKRALVDKAREMALDNVTFVDSVPKSEVVRYWSLLDVSIIHLRDTDLFRTVIPSKLFESMAMQLPVLLGVKGEAARIVEREGIGLVFEPEKADALVEGLVALRGHKARHDDMKAACRSAAGRYDRRARALEMLALLERVCERKPSPGNHADTHSEAGRR